MLKRKISKMLMLVLVFSLTSSLLLGCLNNSEEAVSNEPQVLRILGGWGDDDYMRREWTDYFELTHQNVEVEIIPLEERYVPGQEEEEEEPESYYDRVKRLMSEGTPPDVIFVNNLNLLSQLVQDGLVQPLDTLMEKNQFDIEDIVPAVREGIKDAGDGTSLYALTPTFQSQALYYNKQIFDEKGVPYPTDNMTWEQIIDLAKQVQSGEGEDKIHGLWHQNFGTFNSFMEVFASPLELSLTDSAGKQMTVNTPQWENALSRYIDIYNEEVVALPPQFNRDDPASFRGNNFYDSFVFGSSAMAISHTYLVNNMRNMRMYDPNVEEFDYDIVTVPTHQDAPGIGTGISMSGLMAINRNAQNTDLAWEFIAFHNSEEMLKIKSRNFGDLVSIDELNRTPIEDGPSNIQAFYTLKPAMNPMSNLQTDDNLQMVYSYAHSNFEAMLQGEMSVQEYLDDLQQKGQEILDTEPGEQPNFGD